MTRLGLLALALIGAALQTESAPADIQTSSDARGDIIAVSVFGNSTGRVAMSGTGNASTTPACKFDVACAAVAGHHASTASGTAVAGRGNASGPIALAGGGSASACHGPLECFAVSALGPSEGAAAISLGGNANGCSAPSAAFCVGGSVLGNASGGDASVSAFRESHATSGGGTSLSGFGNSTGSTALSGTGVSNGRRAAALTGDAESTCDELPCVALSATGHASGGTAVSGCDTLSASGRPEACTEWWRPRVEDLLP